MSLRRTIAATRSGRLPLIYSIRARRSKSAYGGYYYTAVGVKIQASVENILKTGNNLLFEVLWSEQRHASLLCIRLCCSDKRILHIKTLDKF